MTVPTRCWRRSPRSGERESRPGATKPRGQSVHCYGAATQSEGPSHADTGSAARFFYCAKATAKDRMDSKHPTVKPLALLNWLVKLITPPGGTVLDPFAGTRLHAARGRQAGL